MQAVGEAIAFVQKHSWYGATSGAVHRTDRWSLAAEPGVAVREAKMASGHGVADYLLFINGMAVGASSYT